MSLENTRDIGTAKVVMVGGGSGGGSNVVPNPSGTATDTLEKVGINGTIYGIEGVDALSDLTDTSISNPSTGQTIEYNSTSGKWENKLSTAVVANPSSSGSADLTKLKVGGTIYNIPSGGGSDVTGNPSSTATSYLAKIKIGNTTYDTSSIIPLFATGITSNYISISATNFAQLENRAVAIYTGSVSGTTQTHWILDINSSEVAIVDESGVAYSADIEAGTIILATIASVGSVMTATVVGVVGYPDPLAIEHGGTGNKVGYIQTGKKSNTTLGICATAEGYDNTASGNCSHAEGRATTAGNYSHAEGYGTTAVAGANHAEGENTTASGYNCHAEGANTTSSNTCTHAEGYQTTASGTYSHAGGRGTVAGYSTQTAIGKWNDNKSDTLFEVGNGASSSSKSNAFEVYSNGNIKAQGTVSDANGVLNAVTANPSGTASTDLTKIKIGNVNYNIPSGGGLPETPLSIAHGGTGNTVGYIRTGVLSGSTIGTRATIEGFNNTASAENAHAEGGGNTASAKNAHAEGDGTTASGTASHAEGFSTVASGNRAHAEGYDTTAEGGASHAEGEYTTAHGNYSHAGGLHTYAGQPMQTVIGGYNNNKASTIFEVGNGTSSAAKNVFEVYGDGCISCDDGSTKFKFSNNGTSDGYYDKNGAFHEFGGGSSGGDTVSKKRYTISASGWSNDTTSDGYYYYNLSLTTALSSLSPNIYVAGTNAASDPTDTEQLMYSYLDKATMANSTIYLYAKTKPTSTFYITVMGVVGSNSGNVACNIIKPNGAHDSLPSLTDTNISSPTNGQVLGYNSTSGKWENQNPSGSGNTKVKTLYGLYASSWSSAPNSDGFYTAQVTLNPTLNPDVTPDILLAGSSASAQPTDTYRTMFSYVERGYMSGSTLTLYAKTKPTSLFKFWVEGVSGSGNLGVACNVIQPNGAVSGGGGIPYIDNMTAPQFEAHNRFTLEGGGYKIEGNICYINMSIKMVFDLTSTLPDGDYRRMYSPWYTEITNLPIPKFSSALLELFIVEKDNTQKRMPISIGQAYSIRNTATNYSDLYITSAVNLTGTTSDIYFIIRGSYDIA